MDFFAISAYTSLPVSPYVTILFSLGPVAASSTIPGGRGYTFLTFPFASSTVLPSVDAVPIKRYVPCADHDSETTELVKRFAYSCFFVCQS